MRILLLIQVKRGLAGTVLVYKIAGALAQRDGSLNEVHQLAEWVSQNIVTVGVSLGHVHVSSSWISSFELLSVLSRCLEQPLYNLV